MARKLYYKIRDDGRSRFTQEQWSEVERLERWYNKEFNWTSGALSFKTYAVFVNLQHDEYTAAEVRDLLERRREEFHRQGVPEIEGLHRLAEENLIILKKGGYFDGCLASGFTRVAGNEFNAYLVCDYLVKASTLIPEATIDIYDEGQFIKTKNVLLQNCEVVIPARDQSRSALYTEIVAQRKVFSIVDPSKYDSYPRYRPTIPDFNSLKPEERSSIVQDWNWLGFETNYDANGDDIRGYNLNEKVRSITLATA